MKKRLINVAHRLSCLGALMMACALLMAPVSARAAGDNTIRGKVLDETGAAAIGASVVLQGASLVGTTTDLDGNFSLQAPGAEAVLVISYMGYESQTIKAKAGIPLTVQLVPDADFLEEVVVTGYGTFKKSAYAGSASTMAAEKIKEVPATSFMELLQGNASGVQFSEQSGQPGSAAKINIRGMGSFNASTSPLYVIDGIL